MFMTLTEAKKPNKFKKILKLMGMLIAAPLLGALLGLTPLLIGAGLYMGLAEIMDPSISLVISLIVGVYSAIKINPLYVHVVELFS